ncbi:hypothetical protein [Caulobacter sp. BP25]|uniref:hypothetical protein n=1 Tax=Caulobacter sp. BP25 TaxID=2048900 RepID=UPI000C12A333|nr:hypothetical protein [Caulobacter sp. BP25]PHY17294.1 hypothetical protein CSW59_19930 [Caulobacter sp. BP25]
MDDLQQGLAATEDEPHFLDDPDVSQAFATMLQEFARESDRGAVLIAADIVAAHLEIVIRELAPSEFGAKRLKEMLNYPGMISSLAARNDVALMAGFISPIAYHSINTLRGLRNNAAHSQGGFRLKDNLELLRKISDLGPGTTVNVNRFAIDAVVTPYFDSLLNKGLEMERETGRNLFPDRATILATLKEHPDTMGALEEQALRTELAFAVWLLLGSIAHKRKSLVVSRAP